MKDFNKEINTVLEDFKSIKTVKREFYPRNFSLSKEFIVAFKKEFDRLIQLGIKPRAVLQKIAKALLFHSRF